MNRIQQIRQAHIAQATDAAKAAAELKAATIAKQNEFLEEFNQLIESVVRPVLEHYRDGIIADGYPAKCGKHPGHPGWLLEFSFHDKATRDGKGRYEYAVVGLKENQAVQLVTMLGDNTSESRNGRMSEISTEFLQKELDKIYSDALKKWDA